MSQKCPTKTPASHLAPGDWIYGRSGAKYLPDALVLSVTVELDGTVTLETANQHCSSQFSRHQPDTMLLAKTKQARRRHYKERVPPTALANW